MSTLLQTHLHRKLSSLINIDLKVNIKIHFDFSGKKADPTRSYYIKPLLSYSSPPLSTETVASTKKPGLSSPQEICCTDGQPSNNVVVRWPCLSYQNDTPLIFQFSLLMPSFMYRSIRFHFLYCPLRTWCLPTTVSCFDILSNYIQYSVFFPLQSFWLQMSAFKYSNLSKLSNRGKNILCVNTVLPKP